MRILLTADPELPVPPELYGGIERIVDALINELRARGHKVALAAHHDSKCPTDAFYPWPGKKSRGLIDGFRNIVALRRAVRRFKPDILHSFSRLGYLLPCLPIRLPKIMSYQRQTGGRQISIAAKLAGRSLIFTGCSEFVANQGRPWGGEWSVIPNFVDTDRYKPSLSVSPDAALVFLSRVERIKGTHTAIKIARQSGRKLIIAGNKVEIGEGPAYWEKEIEPHIDGHNVEYIGPVNDSQKIELLRQAAALLVPIEWDEPFGIVFVEALASGAPVISCPRGALPKIIEHGRQGFLIKSIEEGTKAVEQLKMISREACREQAEKQFSAKVVVSIYEELYARLSRACK